MAAAAAGAFESPADVMRRQFGARATAMHGGGGVMGTQEEGKSALLRDAEATGSGDRAHQVEASSVSTGTGSQQDDALRQGGGGSGLMSQVVGMTHSFKSAIGQGIQAAMPHMPGGHGSTGGGGGCPYMTSMFGQRLQDPSHSLKIGGYPLVSDVVTMEKIQSFTRAKTLERAVHPCGSGALGYFRLTHDMSKYTKASLFTGTVGATTPVAGRFSTTTFGREYPDEARNPRGLAFKFYTADGNYDIMSINFPTFFVRDGALGPDAVRSQQRNPANFQVNFDSMFDFMALVPESMMANLWFWSDHGTPDGWRHMDGYPCHTFKWVNAAGHASFVKYKFISKAGIKNLTQAEAQRVSGIDPDYSKREMWQHINDGKTVEWTLAVQIIPEEDKDKCPVDMFDSSKVWPEELFPWQPVGDVVMDKNPENYHRDVEQIAFSPGRLIPGIEPTPDPLLQWRCWFYLDAQVHRLGVNYHQIPVNSPFMVNQLHPATRDGAMRADTNGGHEPHYFPNSYPRPASSLTGGSQIAAPGTYGPVPDLSTTWRTEKVPANAVVSRGPNSIHEGHLTAEYSQAGEWYLTALNDQARMNMHSNIAYSLRTVSRKEVVMRFLLACYRAAPTLAEGVCAELIKQSSNEAAQNQITFSEVEECNKKLENVPLVDSANGYQPVPLPIKL